MDINKRIIPSRESLKEFVRRFPGEVDVSAVEVQIQLAWASDGIQQKLFQRLMDEYGLSEGRLVVMITLYQEPEGITPSQLADRSGVTRATISAMISRMTRDGLAELKRTETDGRSKKVSLTEAGRAFLEEVLPKHYRRASSLVSNLTAKEQEELLRLLRKLDFS
ncbi:MAG: MarR family transcriptional regulator [Selenomonadales bacterium]|nr:MarR family transcriptional regulator [Selenomonadales bacterium]